MSYPITLVCSHMPNCSHTQPLTHPTAYMSNHAYTQCSHTQPLYIQLFTHPTTHISNLSHFQLCTPNSIHTQLLTCTTTHTLNHSNTHPTTHIHNCSHAQPCTQLPTHPTVHIYQTTHIHPTTYTHLGSLFLALPLNTEICQELECLEGLDSDTRWILAVPCHHILISQALLTLPSLVMRSGQSLEGNFQSSFHPSKAIERASTFPKVSQPGRKWVMT